MMEDSGAVEGGGTKAIEDQIFKVNGGGEGDVKGHGTNKQEVNAVAETLPQHDGNANGQEQTGVTDDGMNFYSRIHHQFKLTRKMDSFRMTAIAKEATFQNKFPV